MRSIHFPPSPAYGGPLSAATEAEVMQFVGMSCHLANCPSHRGPQPAKRQGEARAACCFTWPTPQDELLATHHTINIWEALSSVCINILLSGRKSETTGSMRINRLWDYAEIYLCQSLLFITLEDKLILVYRARFSLTLALRRDSLHSCIILCKFITFYITDYFEKHLMLKLNGASCETSTCSVRVNWPVPDFTVLGNCLQRERKESFLTSWKSHLLAWH